MLGESHDLVHEFPEYRDQIHALKLSDSRFIELFERYHEVNQEVIRIEQEIETPSDAYTEDLKKTRLLLKDQLYTILRSAADAG
jgi:uncharacterized protein YdcH (DUF465 family)